MPIILQTFTDGHQPDSCPDDDASVSIDVMDVSDFELDEKQKQAAYFEVTDNDEDVHPSPRPPMTPRTGARSPERRTAGRQQHAGMKETGRKSEDIRSSPQAVGVRLNDLFSILFIAFNHIQLIIHLHILVILPSHYGKR